VKTPANIFTFTNGMDSSNRVFELLWGFGVPRNSQMVADASPFAAQKATMLLKNDRSFFMDNLNITTVRAKIKA
jgi:hypothetical protein